MTHASHILNGRMFSADSVFRAKSMNNLSNHLLKIYQIILKRISNSIGRITSLYLKKPKTLCIYGNSINNFYFYNMVRKFNHSVCQYLTRTKMEHNSLLGYMPKQKMILSCNFSRFHITQFTFSFSKRTLAKGYYIACM